MKKQEPKSDAQKAAEKLKVLPLDPEYKEVKDIPIPYGRGVLVKKINQSNIKTEGGLILLEGENTTPPHLGIIYAVGPKCSDELKVGTRCYYNFYVDSSFYLDGIHYAKMDENDVYFALQPKALVMEAPKTDKQVRVVKKLQSQSAANKRIFEHEQNEKDKAKELQKGSKVKFILTKP